MVAWDVIEVKGKGLVWSIVFPMTINSYVDIPGQWKYTGLYFLSDLGHTFPNLKIEVWTNFIKWNIYALNNELYVIFL